jgi:DHA2 family multidrug resistance protein-like MFS transporter
MGLTLFVVGLGSGLTFTVTADVILQRLEGPGGRGLLGRRDPYELGAALSIALVGSVVTSVYRGFTAPASAAAASDSLGGAIEIAAAALSAAARGFHWRLPGGHGCRVRGAVRGGGRRVVPAPWPEAGGLRA